MVRESVLYVGADDSNHAGDTKGEIIVATFSFDREDSIVKNFPNTREKNVADKWLSLPRKNFLFSILTSEEYRHSSQNLVKIVPNLIDEYLARNSFLVDRLNIYFDGRIESNSREGLRQRFLGRHGIEQVVVDNFIKKINHGRNHIEKHPRCPSLVYYADIIAHYLYRDKTFGQLSIDKNFIPEK